MMRNLFSTSTSTVLLSYLLSGCGGSSAFHSEVPSKKQAVSANVESKAIELPVEKPAVEKPQEVNVTENEVEPKQPDDTTLYIDRNASAQSGVQQISGGALHLKIDNVISSSLTETSREKPLLSIVFAIDRSSSMGKELDVVKRGVQLFSDNLVKSGFNASFGAVAFQDSVNSSIAPTNLAAFSSYVSGLTLGTGSSNSDLPEGALLAMNSAADFLKSTPADVVPIIVLVTDAIGHNGGSGTAISSRDCSFKPFLDRLAQNDFGDRLVFFHSANPANAVTRSDIKKSCPWASPNQEYSELLTAIESSTPDAFRGQALSWPFDNNVLTNQLPNILVEKIQTKNLTCEMTSARLSMNGATLKSWSRSDVTVDANGNILLPEALTAEESVQRDGQTLNLTVSRCCEFTSDKSCAVSKDQSTSFVAKVVE